MSRPVNHRVVFLAALLLGVLAAVGIVVAEVTDNSANAPTDALAFGHVSVTGDALPTYDAELTVDPASGAVAPVLTGTSTDGTSIEIAAGQPTLVVFLAHWCPHCQRELPVLVKLAENGGFQGIRTVAALTGTSADAPNFPPSEWLEREQWTGDVLVDSDDYQAATAFGLAGYPYIVMLDANGRVVARGSGELPVATIEAMIAASKQR